jgi:uncharacterized protein with GYD domain
MPTYITLINWTGEGVKKVKDSPKRLEAAKKLFKAAGGNLKSFYLVMGQYDIVVVSEAPNDEAASRISLSVASRGAVRTQTLRAFTESEYKRIIRSVK